MIKIGIVGSRRRNTRTDLILVTDAFFNYIKENNIKEVNMTCQECKFFSVNKYTPSLGDCKFNSPTVLLGQFGTMTVFPEVSKDDWCGKFQDKNVKDCDFGPR